MDISVINEKELGAAIAAGLGPKIDQLREHGGEILAAALVGLLQGREIHAAVTVGSLLVEIDVWLVERDAEDVAVAAATALRLQP